MKKNGYKKTACLGAAALILTVGVSTGRALAYFTTYASASGGATLDLGSTTTVPDETFDETTWTKHVTIRNTGAYDCYVRARAYAGSSYELEYPDADGWTRQADGYWYYDQILPAGEETAELLVRIQRPEAAAEEFNVIVVQEHTAVCYREDGTPYADWNLKAGQTEETLGGEG